ncbi:MAG TPA: HAD-IB family hydrolase [Steroidobacteraceae bacterium]
MSNPYAFFDVDGTVINYTSMLSFLDYVERQDGIRPTPRRLLARWQLRAWHRWASREYLNRCYYRLYAGRSVATIERLGRDWFAERDSRPLQRFNSKVVQRLQWHQERGHAVVFVSGGFEACLRPIAAFLGVSHLLCCQMTQQQGLFSGQLTGQQTIGKGKAAAIRDFLALRNGTPEDCLFAYGDHHSDLAMLNLAQHPVVVAGDVALERHARQRHWPIISNDIG